MPDLEERFWQTYGSQGLVVIGIDPDPDDYGQLGAVEAFADGLGVSFPAGVEESQTYEALNANFEGANPYPVDVLIDKQGVIRYIAREYDPDHMVGIVEQLLAE